jgi:hypothetical protein
MQMMIKCADVSHPARSLPVHEEWSARISEEFYRQGDTERRLGLSISPLCDREAHNLAKSQTGFIEFVVRPAFTLLSTFSEVSTWLDCLLANLKHWKDLSAASDGAAAGAGAPAKQASLTVLPLQQVSPAASAAAAVPATAASASGSGASAQPPHARRQQMLSNVTEESASQAHITAASARGDEGSGGSAIGVIDGVDGILIVNEDEEGVSEDESPVGLDGGGLAAGALANTRSSTRLLASKRVSWRDESTTAEAKAAAANAAPP